MDKPSIEIDPAVAEPPALAFVRDYWTRRRGARAMPGRGDINPSDMKPYLPHILLADVIGNGDDFRYRVVGSRLQDYFAANPTGLLMSAALAPFGADTVNQTLGAYRMAVARKGPLRIRGTGAYFAQGSKTFDALLAPLSDDGADVNMIFGSFAFTWDREFADADRSRATEAELQQALRVN